MATFFTDYKKLVLGAYERKKANNDLPNGLKHPTPANLKEECLMRCAKAINRRDETTVREFCGDPDESKNCAAIIQKCDRDRFKPLVNYLKGKSENTDEKNIELLAWLIDFPGRPWELGKKYPGDEDINEGPASGPTARPAETDGSAGEPAGSAPADDASGKKSTDAETVGVNHGKKRGKSTKRLAAAVMLSLALGTGGMWWWKGNNRPPGLSNGCMYWKEDHYEPVACNQKVSNAMVIALDTVKLKYFKKITVPDTITYEAVGKVWYSKIEGKIEFYTSGGEHPVVFGRRLKPITNYMIDKYIRQGMIAQ